MRDQQNRFAGAADFRADEILHPPTQVHIKGGERFVHQQQLRRDGQGASERDALPHPTGQRRTALR